MLTVTWQLTPLIVTLHLLFGLTTLVAAVVAGADVVCDSARRQRRASPRRRWHASLALHRSARARRADRARRLDQQQLRRDRLPRPADLSGQLVAARRFSFRLRPVARPERQLRGRRPGQSGARGDPADAPPRGAVREPRCCWPRHCASLRRSRALARRGRRGAACCSLLQLTIGITMVLRGFPLWLATAHNAGAALLLLATLAPEPLAMAAAGTAPHLDSRHLHRHRILIP